SGADAKRNIGEAVATVANRLGNTPAICRKCYTHPQIIDAYLSAKLGTEPRGEQNSRQQVTGLRTDEKWLLTPLDGKRSNRYRLCGNDIYDDEDHDHEANHPRYPPAISIGRLGPETAIRLPGRLFARPAGNF